MIKPRELESEGGRDIWATMTAAETGDTETLRALLQRDPGLSRAEYFYTILYTSPYAKGISKPCRCCSKPARIRSGTAITTAV